MYFTGDKILTLDTDSFIVGDRVWVNGVRPGVIAYIGETKFAPGEWAGVVLDEPVGKNDGCVGSKRYFYCPPNRGIFSRLWRLTRYPLVPSEYRSPGSPRTLSPVSRSPSPTSKQQHLPTCGILRSRSKSPEKFRSSSSTSFHRREGSPTRSYSSTSSQRLDSPMGRVSFRDRMCEPPNKSLTTVTTTTTTIDTPTKPGGGLKVGDKVFVDSTKGVLAGRLRFLGHTDFAPGYWAGIELDEPLGKNDGTVAGKR